MANQLYEMQIEVLRGDEQCDLPPDMTGAIVPCYAAAPDFESALRKGVAAVRALHYVFKDIKGGEVREISVASWDKYIASVWPEFADHFPAAGDLPAIVEKGSVFFGPFCRFSEP